MTHHKAPSTAWEPCLPCVMLAPGGTPPGPGCLHSPPFLEGFDSGVPASRRCEGPEGLNPRRAQIPTPGVGGKVNSACLLVPPGRESPGRRPWRHQSLVPLAALVCLATQWIAVPPVQGTSRSHEGQQDWAKGIYNPKGSGDQISTWQLPAGELWRWKQNKGARVLEYSWTKGILEHSQVRPLREDRSPAFIASQPHPSLSCSGQSHQGSTQVLAGLSFRPNPCPLSTCHQDFVLLFPIPRCCQGQRM